MSRKCSVPMCALDDSGVFFRLFPIPSNIEVQSEWLKRIGLETGMEMVCPEAEIYLCEIHFDEFCWDDSNCRGILRRTAGPSVFQTTSPLAYINKLCTKLRGANMCPEIGKQGMQAINKLKSEGALEEPNVRSELIQFSCLLGTSAMQKLRISLKSAAIASTKVENIMLAQEITELLGDIKSTGTE